MTHRARLQRVPLIDITTSSVVDARARVGMRAVPREALATLRAIGARRRPRARASVARGSSEAAERVFASTSESATAKLARALARTARNGDVICLRGRVGSGKSALARAFVRARLGDARADVPSPTYLVQQRYETATGEVHHYDLYRLTGEGEVLAMCDLRESANGAISVVEWSERLGRLTPEERLEVHVEATSGEASEVGEVIQTDEDDADEEDEEDEEVDGEEVDEAYVDVAPRMYRLVGFGRWASLVRELEL